MMIWLGRLWAAFLLYARARWNVRQAIDLASGEQPYKALPIDPRAQEFVDRRAKQWAAIRETLGVPPPLPALHVPDAVCEHGTAMDVHCCNCHSGFLFDQHHECPPAPVVDPMVVGVDWAKGIDISVYSCRACGFETSIVEELLKHMKKHGATRLSVLPLNRPPAYKFGDRR